MSSIYAWKDGESQISSAFGDEAKNFGDFLCPEFKNIEAFKPEYFTSRDYWKVSTCPERILGQYRLGTAVAELTRRHTGGKSLELDYWLEMRFEKFEDGQKLYTLIRSGQILPRISYEEQQIKTPFQQMRDLIRIWWRSVITDIRSRMAT